MCNNRKQNKKQNKQTNKQKPNKYNQALHTNYVSSILPGKLKVKKVVLT